MWVELTKVGLVNKELLDDLIAERGDRFVVVKESSTGEYFASIGAQYWKYLETDSRRWISTDDLFNIILYYL